MTGPRRVWREADLPSDTDGYAQVVKLADGEVVALTVTSRRLSPERRTETRRELLRATRRGTRRRD